MFGIDARALRATWTVFVFALIVVLVYQVRHTLVIFTLALFLAHLLGPLVDRLEYGMLSRVPRTLALSIVYLVLVGGAVAILIAVGSKIGEQAASLAARLPDLLKSDPLANLRLPAQLESIRPRLQEMLQSRIQDLDTNVLSVLKSLGVSVLAGLGSLLGIVLIPILSFFFLKDGRAMRNGLLNLVSEDKRQLVEDILADLHILVAQYIRALVLLSIVSLTVNSIFLSIIGVPYPILLAGIAGILEFIPVVGPITAGVVILLVALVSGYSNLLLILIFLLAFRLVQDYVVSPNLMSSGVEIHPLLVLFGVFAGEQVAGIGGMFFSVPVMAGLRIILVRLGKRVHA